MVVTRAMKTEKKTKRGRVHRAYKAMLGLLLRKCLSAFYCPYSYFFARKVMTTISFGILKRKGTKPPMPAVTFR